MKLTLGWLYYNLMNTYGDRGNVLFLEYQARKRGIELNILELSVSNSYRDFLRCDLFIMGGAEDRQQKIVARDMHDDKQKALQEKIMQGTPGVYVCGAYQFLGQYYEAADGTRIKCLDILPLHTQSYRKKKRLVGEAVIQITHPSLLPFVYQHTDAFLIGFENHGGRTYLADTKQALGTTVKGYGNNDTDTSAGYLFKNTIGTYLHGPLLPKNPIIADFLLAKALKVSYNQSVRFKPLHNTIIEQNRKFLLNHFHVKIS